MQVHQVDRLKHIWYISQDFLWYILIDLLPYIETYFPLFPVLCFIIIIYTHMLINFKVFHTWFQYFCLFDCRKTDIGTSGTTMYFLCHPRKGVSPYMAQLLTVSWLPSICRVHSTYREDYHNYTPTQVSKVMCNPN